MATRRHLIKPKILKKRTKKLIRHQSDRCVKIKKNWRKPRDNRVRRRFKGQMLMLTVTTAARRRNTCCLQGSGSYLVHNIKELEALMMSNKTHCAEITHNVHYISKSIGTPAFTHMNFNDIPSLVHRL
uniref:60S ribosomal protein L32 n=1 Tax=Paramormyrops kingsleyae TaxID=1676925 RepID=A0A3B3SBS4_9TELE